MRLYERFADKNYHTSVATTFGVDFDAYESIALSRLRGAGCHNNLIVSDSRMLTHALAGASDLPQKAGTSYTISGTNTAGVFHPKLFLQFGRKGGRLIIGSANLTPSGLAGNLEMVGMLSCDEADSGEQQLIAQAWHYAKGFIDGEQQSVSDQLLWMQSRTGWLQSATSAKGTVQLLDGTRAAVLLSGEPTGIAQRFTALIDEPVTRMIVISPYWDPELAALSYLAERLNPQSLAVLVDPLTREFPKDAAHRIDNLALYSRGSFREGRFIHAKAIIAQTPSADHVLFGSANCTNAALGGRNFAGSNAEACLYRELPAGSFIQALELHEVLTDDKIIAPDDLSDPEQADDIPLSELAKTNPGRFEGSADSLTWHTKSIENAEGCKLSLLSNTGQPVECRIKAIASHTEHTRRFQIEYAEKRPAFAHVTFAEGNKSTLAIINWIDTLKLEVREPLRWGLQKRIDELESDTEAGLAIVEIMNELESLELNQSRQKTPISVPRSSPDDITNQVAHKELSYEQFIAGRRPRTTGNEFSYNSLAGSDVSIVRRILNRIIGFGEVTDGQAGQKGDQPEDSFDLGDETDDAEGAMASGSEFGKQSLKRKDTEKEKRVRRAEQRRATQEQLIKAVQHFQARIKERQDATEPLTNYDLIRLRALIMILATAASPHARLSKEGKDNRSRIRILPVEGSQNSWPMLMGRLLFTFFGGNNPAIRLLHLTDEHDQIPGDFNECWATCYWAFEACMNATLSTTEKTRIDGLLKPMAKKAFLLTLPSKDELLADDIISVINRMNESYAEPLAINPDQIQKAHRTLVEATFTAARPNSQYNDRDLRPPFPQSGEASASE